MAIEVTNQTVRVTEVTDVVMTTIEQDLGVDGTGSFIREIRVVGTAIGSSNPPQVFVLRLEAATGIALEITTPPLQV